MAKQVLTIEQMNTIESFGIIDISKANAYRYKTNNGMELAFKGEHTFNKGFNVKNEEVWYLDEDRCHIYPTFTLSDILEVLPKHIILDGEWHDYVYSQLLTIDDSNHYTFRYNWSMSRFSAINIEENDKEPIDAAYHMLIWMLKNSPNYFLNKENYINN